MATGLAGACAVVSAASAGALSVSAADCDGSSLTGAAEEAAGCCGGDAVAAQPASSATSARTEAFEVIADFMPTLSLETFISVNEAKPCLWSTR